VAEVGRFRSEVMYSEHQDRKNNAVQLFNCSTEIGGFTNISIGMYMMDSVCSASAKAR
jgi:hypothetical protein